MNNKNELLRSLPAVDELIRLYSAAGDGPSEYLADGIRIVIDKLRTEIINDEKNCIPSCDELIAEAMKEAAHFANARSSYNLRPVVNATGIVLHTNLGRAPLSKKVAEHVCDIAENYSNLEYRLDTGERGSRYALVEDIICRLTECEAALVVNNNAAAVLLMLSALCKDLEVIVSRGELVEIGGSFRVPDVMRQSGAILREVGATNKTRLSDYESAIIPNVTGAFLKVHTSNFKIVGFTEETSLAELRVLGEKHNIPVLYDFGSGLLLDNAHALSLGIPDEPTIKKAAVADIVCFSGDKLFGGPQAGIIAGKKIFIDKLKSHPLNRALRIDKLTLAALEATLKLYEDYTTAVSEIPVLEMLTASMEQLRIKAERLLRLLTPVCENNFTLKIIETEGQAGGGTAPGQMIPSVAIAVRPHNISVDSLEEQLRHSPVPIIARIKKDCLLLDMRTVREEQFTVIADAFFVAV